MNNNELKKNLLSPLSIALMIILSWLIVFEMGYVRNFTLNYQNIWIEYIILISIPLFTVILILTVYKSRIGFVFGFFLGLGYMIFTSLLIIMNINPGPGPIIVIPTSIAVSIFSMKGLMENVGTGGKIPKPAFFIMRQVQKLRKNPKKMEQLLENSGVKENMKVLDYGCGIGNYTMEAAKIVGKSGTVFAVDINIKMIQEVEKAMKINGLSNIKTILINSMEDVKENNLNFIFLIDIIHLIDKKIEIIDFLLNKLATNGKLLIKFEHMDKTLIGRLLINCRCSEKVLVFPNKKYWLISK